jgi:hypothetical protein
MNNYVLIYRFSNVNVAKEFRRVVDERYHPEKIEKEDVFEMISFSAASLPQIESEFNELINNLDLGSEDYVALYYTRNTNPDSIKRVMLLGPVEFMEMDMNAIAANEHEKALIELIEK